MQIQVNSDNHIESSIRLEEWVKTTVESALDRFEEDLTRVEVHIQDENGDKPGPHDIRCQMEARPKGHQPVSVTHKADSLDQAVDGAAVKLEHALEHLFGKLRSKRGNVSPIGSARSKGAEHPDALLQEEFLEKDEARHG
jgi:ribosome-associated translation inhibitor RaiA